MMPPPWGSSRSSTPCANATPIQTTPRTVIAIPSVPARRCSERDREQHRNERHQGEQDVQVVAGVGGDDHARDAEEAGAGGPARCPRTGRTARRGRRSPAPESPSVNQIPPSAMIVIAYAIAGIATITPRAQRRAAAATALHPRRRARPPGGGGPCEAISGPRTAACARRTRPATPRTGAVEVRPQLVAKDQLGIGGLPHEVVAQPLLAARADDDVGVVHLGGVQQRPEVLLVAILEMLARRRRSRPARRSSKATNSVMRSLSASCPRPSPSARAAQDRRLRGGR